MAADVKWIKVYTDMVSNKKIKRIRTLPEGNNIVLIWLFLLAQAGENNKNGALYLTDTLPFRTEDLAVEFDFEISVINLALITLEKFSMIEVFDEVIYIKNWEEYQNIEGLDKIRKQTALRVANHRASKQLLLEKGEDVTQCNVTVTQGVTHGNGTELELELDKDTYIDDFFKNVWLLYPNKKGVGKVHKTQKKILHKLGIEKITNCIESYKQYVESERKRGFDLRYKDGSTFFNSGYEDYLSTPEQDKPTRPPLTIVVEDRD